MKTDATDTAIATWATRELPGRLDVAQTAKLLGFGEHDIQILMAVGKLTPLGDPAPNAPKWFAAVEMVRLATDEDWLHKATKELAKYWRNKRERRLTPAPPPRSKELPVSVSAFKRQPVPASSQEDDVPGLAG